MSERDQFCCVSCESMLSQKEAYVVFRTGFFRSIHPLGYCKTCHGMHLKADLEAAAARPLAPDGDTEEAETAAASGPARYGKPYPSANPYPLVVSL